MKIVHLIWAFPVGGAETMLVDIMNEQVKNNNVVLVIINKNYNDSLLNQVDSKVKIFKIDRSLGSKNPIFFIYLNFLLIHIFPNVVHCHNFSISNVLLPFLLKNSILTIHGFKRPINKNNKYKKVIAISNAIKYDLEKKGLRNIKVVQNGVLSSTIEEKSKFNDCIQIVCIGRLDHEIKGQDLLIKAFSNLIKKKNKIKLHFIGDGPSFNYLNNLSSELKVEKDIIFHGLKSRTELYNTLKDFDIVVQPSIHEGFGLSAVEAMIAKVPLIISNAHGLKEVTNNGKLAIVSNNNRVEEYELNLEKLLHSIEEKELTLFKLLEEARIFAMKNFSLDSTCKEYFKIYNY